jgi:predicted permease
MIRRHAVAAAILLGIVIAALFVILRVTGPAWLIHALQPLLDFAPIGLGLLVAGLLLSRRGWTWVHPITVLAGLWSGFVVGFFVVMAMTFGGP